MAEQGQEAQSKERELLATARERFLTAHTAELDIRAAALEDIRFTYNVDEGQWPAEIRSERLKDGRPCLTMNKLRKFVATVANQERENRFAGKVRAVDDQGDPQIAQVLEDLTRQIEYQSRADEVYSSAGEQAAASGFGYWRVLTQFPDDGFDQEIVIRHIDNQFSVYMDPTRSLLAGKPARYAFISDFLTKDEFTRQYPGAAAVDFDSQSTGEEWTLWYETDTVRVAEYFQFEPTTRELAQVRHPVTRMVMVVELREGLTAGELARLGWEVIRTRKADSNKVRWYKITGREILEERDWPGKLIPVVEVVGDRVNIAGKVYKRSLIRDGKDPQRAYNYWLTTETETVALAPKAPFLVTPQEISGHEQMWDTAHRRSYPYLLYNAQGQRIPRREMPPQVSTGHQGLINIANNDIKDTLGMYESFVGEPSNERSGRAIFARERRSQVGTFHFADNLRRAVVETQRILIDLIPSIYDAERVVRLRNEQDEERLVRLNQTVVDPSSGQQVTLYDLRLGKYDVQADVRLYSTRRQEMTELLVQAIQYAPLIAPALVPLLFKFMDAPGAAEVEQVVRQFLQQAAQGGNGKVAPGGPVPGPSPAVPGVPGP